MKNKTAVQLLFNYMEPVDRCRARKVYKELRYMGILNRNQARYAMATAFGWGK